MKCITATMAASLNRTSVGLKQLPDVRIQGGITGPQSNQRGIETSINRLIASLIALDASIEPAWD